MLVREEIAPGIAAVVYHHLLKTGMGMVPAWTFVTEGRAASSQPELVVTVLRSRGRDVADFPRELLPTLAGMATTRGPMPLRQGMSAVIGLETPPLLAGTELRAIYVRDSGNNLDLPLPPQTLTAVFMTHEEHSLAQVLGYVRWAGRIGREASTFPTPWWIDPERAPVLAQAEAQASMLTKMPRRYLIGTSVIYEPGSTPPRLTLTIEPVADQEFQAMARKNGDAFALLTDLNKSADAYLVWRPGQAAGTAISRVDNQGERIGGNFLMLVSEPNAADEFRIIEDGFALILKPATWERLTTAIAAAAPLELPLKDAVAVLEWPTTTHVDPSGVSHEAGILWNTYYPEGKQSPRDPNRPRTDIVLLTPEDVIEQRITVNALAEYMKQLEAAVQEHERASAGSRPANNLVVDVELTTDKPPALSLRCDHAAELGEYLPQLAPKLRRIPAPKVTDSVHFLLQIAMPAAAAKRP